MYIGAVVKVQTETGLLYGQVISFDHYECWLKVIREARFYCLRNWLGYFHDRRIVFVQHTGASDPKLIRKTLVYRSDVQTQPPAWWQQLQAWWHFGDYRIERTQLARLEKFVYIRRQRIRGFGCVDGYVVPQAGCGPDGFFYYEPLDNLILFPEIWNKINPTVPDSVTIL